MSRVRIPSLAPFFCTNYCDPGSLDFPQVPILVEAIRIDAEKGFGFANGPLVGHSIQTHRVPLSQGVVVFEAETIVLPVQYPGYFHCQTWIELELAATNASAR